MAPRSRSRAGKTASVTPAAASIADLPDAVLTRCLGHLEFKERQRLALVSKRFAAAACSPELLREVDVGVVEGLQAMRSLTAWLARYSQHVRQLCIIAVGEELKDSDGVTAIASCVATAGAAGQLEQLELEGSFGSTEWLAAVRSLRHLGIVDSDHGLLPVSPAISGLTALNSLDLRGELQLADTRLPGCITRLVVGDLSDEMPQQVAHLPRLARLELLYCHYSAASMGQLSSLAGSLTRLRVEFGNVPAALPVLTRLQHLSLDFHNLWAEEAEAVDAALQRLTQLTCLVLGGPGVDPPAALARLSHLQRCYLHNKYRRPAGSTAASPLPAGPWLTNLRWLGASIDVLMASVGVLQAAGTLEFVEVRDTEVQRLQRFDWMAPVPTALCEWLSRHPPLRQVSFSSIYTGHSPESHVFESSTFAARMVQLTRRRPALRLRCGHRLGDFSETMISIIND